jgi:hypothetical protein
MWNEMVNGVFYNDISVAFCEDIGLLFRSMQLTCGAWFVIEAIKPVSVAFYK